MLQRVFSLADQTAFATISGDFNPLHVDAVQARRLMFGAPVVHGIHLLLWALDCWLADNEQPIELSTIKVVFQKPVKVGEPVNYQMVSSNNGQTLIELYSQGRLTTKLLVSWDEGRGATDIAAALEDPARAECRALTFDEVADATGSVPLHVNRQALATLLPAVGTWLSALQVAQLLATTRLVGMECPGLHSVFSGLELHWRDEVAGPPALHYQVARLDRRFGLVSMTVNSPGMQGTVTAFMRPPPRRQIDMQQLRGQVKVGEFAGQRALVIGGSRGLGEVSAKLLAAGGADVYLTYAKGAEDAQRVVDDIRQSGGRAHDLALDIRSAPATLDDQLAADWCPTHLYYYATPFIADGNQAAFSMALFQRFCDFYLAGFITLFEHCKARGLRGALYPSTVFIDELKPNMGEYAAAKAAGELLCAFLERFSADIPILRPRLPKMATDQTASFLDSDTQAPVPVLLHYLRELHQQAPVKAGC